MMVELFEENCVTEQKTGCMHEKTVKWLHARKNSYLKASSKYCVTSKLIPTQHPRL